MDEEHDQVPQCQCRVGGARWRMEFDFVIAVALAPDFEIQRIAKVPRHVVGAYVVIRVEKFDDRLRKVELQVARLDERTRQGVVTVQASGNININLPGEEE